MTPFDLARIRVAIDELANALQVVVLIAEHLERASSATAQDARTITRSLERVRTALQRIQADGGDEGRSYSSRSLGCEPIVVRSFSSSMSYVVAPGMELMESVE
jgi:hypothetical protein